MPAMPVVRHERGGARPRGRRHDPLSLARGCGCDRAPATGVVVDLSGAHRLRDASSYEAWYGFTHPRPGGLGDWVYGLTELVAESGRLIANPGCYATATLLALAPLKDAIEPDSVVVDGLSGMTGAGRTLKASSHAGAVLENVSPYRVGAHQHVPEIAQLLGFPVSLHAAPPARPARADRDLQRPLHRARPARAARGGIRRQRGRHGPAGRDGAGARPRPAHRPRRDRRLRRQVHRSHDRHLRRGQPRQGRRRPGDPERQPRARARGRPPGSARRGAGLAMSVTAAAGVRRERRHCRDPAVRASRRRRRALGPARRRRRRVDDESRPGGSGHRLEAPPRARRSRRPC